MEGDFVTCGEVVVEKGVRIEEGVVAGVLSMSDFFKNVIPLKDQVGDHIIGQKRRRKKQHKKSPRKKNKG